MEGKWNLAVCLYTAFQARTRSSLCGGNARRSLSSHCTVGNLMQCTWAGHAIPVLEVEAVPMLTTYWHVHRIPSCPLGSYNHMSLSGWALRLSAWGADITGLTEHRAKGTKRVEFSFLLAPQWEWQRGRKYMNSVAAMVQCCTHMAKEMGDICSVSLSQLDSVSVCIQNYVLKYLKRLHKALGRTELNQI